MCLYGGLTWKGKMMVWSDNACNKMVSLRIHEAWTGLVNAQKYVFGLHTLICNFSFSFFFFKRDSIKLQLNLRVQFSNKLNTLNANEDLSSNTELGFPWMQKHFYFIFYHWCKVRVYLVLILNMRPQRHVA